MSEFVASNGLTIATHREYAYLGWAIYDSAGRNQLKDFSHLNDGEMKALREFFHEEHPDLIAARARWQHQEDARLGRWRWPENPDYVVYADEDGAVNVLRESGPYLQYFERTDATGRRGEYYAAARAYFEAHPEPKPWHDAETGELWWLSLNGGTVRVKAVAGSRDAEWGFNTEHGQFIGKDDPGIHFAERLYPAVAS